MINKVTVALSVVAIVVLGFFVYKKYFVDQKIHYHVGYRVFVDGVLQDFSGPEYMSLKPCTTKASAEDEQNEKAHLHDRIGYVVHVHRVGAKWRDLFTNIHYTPDPLKPITAYINGRRNDAFMDETIHAYDSAVILIGKYANPAPYIQQAVTVKDIKAVEKKSENCGSGS